MSEKRGQRIALLVAAGFLAGIVTGLALPQMNLWPYSACHGLGGAIEIAEYDAGRGHDTNCVIPWERKSPHP